MEKEFTSGQVVYHNNQPANFIQKLNAAEAVVEFIHSFGDDEDYYESSAKVIVDLHRLKSEKIDTGEKFAAEERELTKKIQAKIAEANQELRNIEKKMEDARSRLSVVDSLKHVFDFLDGKITHYVVEDWSTISIQTFQEAHDTRDNWNREEGQKLLVLVGTEERGRKKRDFDFRLNSYSDGSGSYKTVLPCSSLEEAKTVAIGVVEKRISEGKHIDSKSLKKFMAEHDISTPVMQEFLVQVAEKEAASRTKRIQELQAELTKLENA